MNRVLFVALLAACKRDGAYGPLPDARVTFTADGEGEPNAGELQPLGGGTRWSTNTLWDRWAGSVDAGRDDLLVHESSGGNQPGAPTVGSGVGLYRSTRDGLVIHALDEPLDEDAWPILMVPDTVRVGMSWDSEFRDGDVNRMIVSAHTTVNLPTGPAEVWGIAEYADATTIAVTRWYAEGIGRIGTSTNESSWSPAFGPTELVVADDPQAHAEPALTPAALVSVLPREDHAGGHETWGLSGVVRDGTLWALIDGEDPALGYTPVRPHDSCVVVEDPPRYVEIGVEAGCPITTIEVPVPDPGYGWTTETILVDNAAKLLPGVDEVLDLSGAGTVHGDTLTGWVEDGVVHTLAWAEDDRFRPRFVEFIGATDPPTYEKLTDGLALYGMHLTGHREFDDTTTWKRLDGQLWLAPGRVDAGAPVPLAVIAADGQVFRVTLADGTLSGFTPVGVLPGAVSVLVEGDERSAYSITTDGRVFELRLDLTTGDIAINGLGAVRVEEPGGLYEFKGVLPDPTHPGDVYVAAMGIATDELTAWPTGLFRAHLDEAPLPVVTAASVNVGAAVIDAGLAVCWPPTDEAFDGTGWTLRGEPVDVFGPAGPDGNCAVVAYDAMAPAGAQWAGAELALAATLPGVGRVRIGFPVERHVGHTLSESVSVLRDGSIVDHLGVVLDPVGLPRSRTYTPGQPGSQDLGGYGLWSFDQGEVHNVGGGLATPPCPIAPTDFCLHAGAVLGGGMLYLNPTAPTGVQVVRPDGTVEDLPAAQAAGVRSNAILLDDGRLCRVSSDGVEIVCVAPDGAIASTGPLYAGTIAPPLDGDTWWPLADGSLLLANYEGPSWRFDPDTLAFSVLDPRVLHGKHTAADGRVYAIATALDGTSALVEVSTTGVTDLFPVGSDAVVVPIEGAFLVRDATSPRWRRIPR